MIKIVQGLEKLSREGNNQTRKTAFQLYCAATRPIFIIATSVIAKYSAIVEPVANILQTKNIDLMQCSSHVQRILKVVEDHRKTADQVIDDLLSSSNVIAEEFLIKLSPPRKAQYQQHRANHPAESSAEYWKRSILVPYLDSLSSALKTRFCENNEPAFQLFHLHPFLMLDCPISSLHEKIKCFSEFYDLDIDKIHAETELWYNLWRDKKMEKQNLKDLELTEVIKEANHFFPQIKSCLIIALVLPCSTSTIERSFSTLRRVKTWLRSTMNEERLNGLCMLSIHKKLVHDNMNELQTNVMEKFAENPRRLMLV